ncbi:uncharacterized protein LOC134262558 [Saccostrea cucullata]|uniref:uncharacterized protein LOC134262558 n=1 Tax=Saccostrea cuccullata TaxID=36930 RepID=UPI002ECFBCE4
MLVDTGSSVTIINEAFASQSGLDILKDCACYIDVANDSVYINDECISFISDASSTSESVQDACNYKNLNGIEISESVESGEKEIDDFYVSGDLGETERKSITQVLDKYRKVFAFSDNELGKTDLVEHSIDTGDSKPIHLRPYRIPHSQRMLLESQIETMCANGIVRPSKI